ncbi:MAG: class I SAM-dependent methyltransferase [Acidobacteriia bacterium]|nr:class I SAM-dependent methyltransferase [Terriglobia bacterium]
MQVLQPADLYKLDDETRSLLIDSAPLMWDWSRTKCKHKEVGGMEEWAKTNKGSDAPGACDWYHGTWQFLRLLNMVAVPPWYEFYNDALSTILRKKPTANVLISACADYGMLATLHEAIKTAKANPTIKIYDICATPLTACEWYAKRHGLKIECFVDNLITSPSMPLGSFDLIVTDEFLTVLKSEYKPMITERWLKLLAPGGSVVTTAMIGGVTTPELRRGYAERSRSLSQIEAETLEKTGTSMSDLLERFEQFAEVHTRHMLVDENEIRGLFSKFDLKFLKMIPTPGECVNPTNSYQIVAARPTNS